jgi:hypothetical protein
MSEADNAGFVLGGEYRLLKDVYDDGCDSHHPPGYMAVRGDMLTIREIRTKGPDGLRFVVSHEGILDRGFIVFPNELKLP